MTETAYPAPAELPVVRIFISSPGDVQSERRIATEIVNDELAKRSAILEHAVLRVVRYDDPQRQIPLLVQGISMQEAVNHGLPKASQCHIVVGILWGRMGTPLDEPLKADNSRYLSGTEWEIEDALRESLARWAEQSECAMRVIIEWSETLPAVSPEPYREPKVEPRITMRRMVDTLARDFGEICDKRTGMRRVEILVNSQVQSQLAERSRAAAAISNAPSLAMGPSLRSGRATLLLGFGRRFSECQRQTHAGA
jgi:hypothetical protein